MSTDPHNIRNLDNAPPKVREEDAAVEHPTSEPDGPGQAYGLTNRQNKDEGDGFTRAPDFPPSGEVEQPRPTPNAADSREEPAESD